jgi:acid phosphatase type 7
MSYRLRPALALALLLGSAIAFVQCGGGGSPTSPAPVAVADPVVVPSEPSTQISDPVIPTAPPVVPLPGNTSTFVNVLGDTGWCGSPALGPLSRLFERFDGDILLAGDLAYPSGTIEEFRNCFDPSFGKFKSRMRATPGNHDYVSSVSANAYFNYFGDRAGPSRAGYYSFKAAEWTVFMLNSNIPIGKGSPQWSYVRQTMQQTPTQCTMAVLHHPFDSSGINGPTPSLRDIWELMYNLGADVIIAGHDHLYERHAPVNADQRRDDLKGIRQFTVGTGGAPLYNKVRHGLNSQYLVSNYGMLRLRLAPALYEWQFMDMNGNVLDPGLAVCH